MTQLTPEAYELFTEFNRNFFWIDDGIPDSSLLPLAAALRKLAEQLEEAHKVAGPIGIITVTDHIKGIADNMTAFRRPNRVRYTGFQPSYIPVRTDRWQGRQEDLDGEGRSWRISMKHTGQAQTLPGCCPWVGQ